MNQQADLVLTSRCRRCSLVTMNLSAPLFAGLLIRLMNDELCLPMKIRRFESTVRPVQLQRQRNLVE